MTHTDAQTAEFLVLTAREIQEQTKQSYQTVYNHANAENWEKTNNDEGKKAFKVPLEYLDEQKSKTESKTIKNIQQLDPTIAIQLAIDQLENRLTEKVDQETKDKIQSLEKENASLIKQVKLLETNNQTLNRELDNRASQIKLYKEEKRENQKSNQKPFWKFW